MKFYRYFLFWSVSFFFTNLHAQSLIKGFVKSENDETMPYASVRLLQQDSTFVQGTSTDANGSYTLHVQQGKYLLAVSSIGYQTKVVNLVCDGKDKLLPTIILYADDVMLSEVQVIGESFIRQDDRILIIPDKQVRKHSFTGYDLLYNLMIPNIEVDRRKGSVSTMGGSVTLYVDGREVDYLEVKNLRPKDIEKIEYFDIPTGEYAGDIASINFITKKQENGGYVSLDADQAIGYLKGDYNVVAKMMHGNTSYTLFAGHGMQKYDDNANYNTEFYHFSDKNITKQGIIDLDRIKNNQQYAQLNILNQTSKRKLLAKLSFVHKDSPKNMQESSLAYSALYGKTSSKSATDQQSFKPAINLFGEFHFKENQQLKCYLSGDYTNNKYNRSYAEDDFLSRTNVKEEMFTFSPKLQYYIKLKHRNSLTVEASHYHRISSTSYTGDSPSWQHLWSGETLLFLSYNQKLNSKLTLDGQIGMSSLQYRLHGEDKITHMSPRGYMSLIYRIAKKQQLGGGIAIGNAYPEINTINTAEQTVDMLHVKRGNPYLSKITLASASVNYSLQFGRFNLFSIFMYNTELNTTLPAFFIEGDKIVETFHSEGDYHSFHGGLDLSYKITDALRLLANTRWQYGLITGKRREHQNNVYGRLLVNYFWKDFSLNVYGELQKRTLNSTGVYGIQDGRYGLSVSWMHGNWMLEAGTNNPFWKHNKTRSYLVSDVYGYDRYRYDKTNQQSGYVKVAYTFDFGKKTSRDRKDVNTQINSTILKVN